VCDYLIVLVGSRVQVAGDVRQLLATHYLLSGQRADRIPLPQGAEVISAGQDSLLVRAQARLADPGWIVKPASLEDLVLAYMSRTDAEAGQ